MADRIDRTRITADASQFNSEMEAAAEKYISESQRMASAMREAMQSVQQSTRNTTDQAKKSGDELGQVWGNVKGKIVGAVAAAASTGAVAAAVSKTVEWTKESEKLSRALGITTTEASVLNVALGDIHQSADVVLTANRAMTRSLRENEESFTKLGIATRDQNGNFRNSLDIMMDVNKHLLTFKEGTDRNIEGQKIYKKAWEEVAPVLKLTSSLMEDSRAKAERLGLVVGKENVEAVARYRAAQNDAQDVSRGLAKVIGEAVMPVLTQLFNDMSETGPQKIAALREAMGYLVAAFWSAKTVIFTVWEGVKAFVSSMAISIAAAAEVGAHLAKGNWKGAVAAVSEARSSMVRIAADAAESIATEFEKNRARTAAALEAALSPQKPTSTGESTGGAGSTGGKKDMSGFMTGLEAELAAMRDSYERQKLLQGSFEQFSRTQESAFWQSKIALTEEGSKERADVEKKYYAAERDVRKLSFEADMETMKVRIDEEKKNATARIDMAGRVYQANVQRYGAESKEAIAALAAMQRAANEYFTEIHKLQGLAIEREKSYQLSRVELERANLETLSALGQITNAQKLEALRNLKEIEYQTELKAIQDQSAMYEEGTVEYEQYLNKLQALKEKHEVEMRRIDGQIQVESFRTWRQIGDSISGAFSTAVQGVIMGTQSITQAMRNMAQSILLSLIDMGVKWLVQQAVNEMIGEGITKGAAQGKIMANAAVAASGAAASVAAIPYWGWAAAPGVAAETFAATEAWASVAASAAGGYDVPAGVNPVTQLHEKEMVLPAKFADPLRDMLEGGGGQTDGGFAPVINIKAIDARSVQESLRAGGALRKELFGLARRFEVLRR